MLQRQANLRLINNLSPLILQSNPSKIYISKLTQNTANEKEASPQINVHGRQIIHLWKLRFRTLNNRNHRQN